MPGPLDLRHPLKQLPVSRQDARFRCGIRRCVPLSRFVRASQQDSIRPREHIKIAADQVIIHCRLWQKEAELSFDRDYFPVPEKRSGPQAVEKSVIG